MLLALRVAPCQLRLRGSLSSLQPATDRLCRKDEEQIRLQGSLSSWLPTTDALCQLDENLLPVPLSSRSSVAATNWKAGAPVPQAGGQRKVLLASDVMRFATPCS